MTLSSQQPPDNSQLPGEAASLSQEIAALSPAGSLSANRIQRPPPETYSEQNNDDADYEDTSDNDDDSNLPSASTSNPSSQNTAGVQSTAAATLSTATTTSLPPQPPLPDRTRHPVANAFAVREAARPHGGIPVGASRYFLPAWWNSHNEAHMLWAKNALETPWPAVWLPARSPAISSSSSTPRRARVDRRQSTSITPKLDSVSLFKDNRPLSTAMAPSHHNSGTPSLWTLSFPEMHSGKGPLRQLLRRRRGRGHLPEQLRSSN
ncbi:hypothetical protein A4X06_0g8473 [Tilletia controversa]|uniref:Uncharacterized protein n=1 Tax=Tilletia controversa TaxID=13291 RepID=A0A8X7ST53_9BASI|nr:hypothetical protein A4X06_0g8473 [Tilletia controversa]